MVKMTAIKSHIFLYCLKKSMNVKANLGGFLGGLLGDLFVCSKGSPIRITKCEKLAKIAVIMCMVYGVVLCTHYWLRIARNSVVNICRPHPGEKEHNNMCEIMHRDEEETDNIRRRLHKTIDGIKCN